jgi:hypothetical protein
MIKEIIVYEGQNLIDIAIQEYGDLVGAFYLVFLNPRLGSIDYVLKAGEILLIDSTKQIKSDVVEYFEKRNIKINTGDDFIFFAEFNDDFNEDFLT